MMNMYNLMKRMFPICRSITGNGVRETLKIIKEHLPKLEIHEVPSGTEVFDWTVPKEWNINDAWVKNSKGEKVIDFKESNLHVLNYSAPINKKVSFEELKTHLFTLEDYPDRIPYMTSYYNENWGFSIAYNEYKNLDQNDEYEVYIDSSLDPNGSLTYGELYIEGEIQEEVLFSTYVCHPSLCNDNLSGVVMLTALGEFLQNQKLHYSYRLIFVPETIGSISWLSRNEDKISNIKYGLVASCVAGPENATYKKTRDGNCEIDRVVEKVLKDSGEEYRIVDFFPWGSDERQFCSPGFNMPVGSLMKASYGFDGYHTSADNFDYVKGEQLESSFTKYKDVVFVIENDFKYINLNPKCEPQLGKRGLYDMLGGRHFGDVNRWAMFWVLNLSDGEHSLVDIAYKSGMSFRDIKHAADMLVEGGLLKVVV